MDIARHFDQLLASVVVGSYFACVPQRHGKTDTYTGFRTAETTNRNT
jgi:hypothetical protein